MYTNTFHSVKEQEPTHVKGITLCEQFYVNNVSPILSKFPQFEQNHCACLIGFGSEVLGYDTRMSEDHDYGPRLIIILPDEYYAEHSQAMHNKLAKELPRTFLSFPTHYEDFSDEPGVKQNKLAEENAPINHGVKFYTVQSYFSHYWGSCDNYSQLSTREWLSIPQQRLLGVTAGKIYHDGFGTVSSIRQNASYYPTSIWLYMIVVQFSKIGQDVAFVGRTSIVDDHLGSQLLVASLVKDMMKLCFLIEKKYYPYNKWFGTAFKAMNLTIGSLFERVILNREDALVDCYVELVDMINKKVLCTIDIEPITVESAVHQFHGRPFIVFDPDVFIKPIMNLLVTSELDTHSENVRAIINDGLHKDFVSPVGAIDQVICQTEFLEQSPLFSRFGQYFF